MKLSKLNHKFLLLNLLVITFLVGCKSDGEEIEQPEKIYYDQAQARMESGNYFGAIEALEAIDNRYPFGKYAEQAQVELVYAYFMKGISSYTRDRDLLIRYTNTDISNRDISGAKESFAELTEFITRFPDSQYIPYAKQRNVYLRNMIAKNELVAADYYLTIDAHVGAIRRANYVIENIPNSSENFRALKILEVSYAKLGYNELLDDVRKVIKTKYPNRELEEISNEESWSWNFLNRSKPKNSDKD